MPLGRHCLRKALLHLDRLPAMGMLVAHSPGGHLRMFTQPNQLAALIAAFHAEVSGYEWGGG
ncbi:hypothetical protein CVS29_12295 [Arthrobacter psychrochitiniphilus]|uniref:Uncharacterized protein n=1 Tax=Arthrobacter psychrochitiniphilus TaxID=291045 RepID=A0A2V3DPT0_9MICC|nr:hypothetical protein CVS29_12295 [Arthrobacter psychrochitiniphilus]